MSEKKFGEFLRREFLSWAGKQNSKGIPSQADFAKWLQVPTTSLSTWMNDVRVPVGENIDKLADRLGVEVYDLLGAPRKMPRSKKLYLIAMIWSKLPPHLQDRWYEEAKKIAEQKEEAGISAMPE